MPPSCTASGDDQPRSDGRHIRCHKERRKRGRSGRSTEALHEEAALTLLTVAQVAARAGVTTRTVRADIAHGRLPVLRLGRAVRVDRADVDRYRLAGQDRDDLVTVA
jgi:excisionase family DNA binding protein